MLGNACQAKPKHAPKASQAMHRRQASLLSSQSHRLRYIGCNILLGQRKTSRSFHLWNCSQAVRMSILPHQFGRSTSSSFVLSTAVLLNWFIESEMPLSLFYIAEVLPPRVDAVVSPLQKLPGCWHEWFVYRSLIWCHHSWSNSFLSVSSSFRSL